MYLLQLQPGKEAKVTDMTLLGGDTRRKLMTMGILPGTPIRIVRKAPMGDPIQIEVREVSLAIRRKVAEIIKVEVMA
ncbi:FeoA family protein [Vibrio sp. WXL103]|uniref:FeoA family protein n=1 Tax=Vibrio sp. WXL103 TaxID=3450710 RepID=UPI003EC739E4